MEYKEIKNLKNSFLTLMIISIIYIVYIIFVVGALLSSMGGNNTGFIVLVIMIFKYYIIGPLVLVLSIIGYLLSKKHAKIAGFIGIFLSALMFYNYKNILSLIVGIILLIESLKYLKLVKSIY